MRRSAASRYPGVTARRRTQQFVSKKRDKATTLPLPLFPSSRPSSSPEGIPNASYHSRTSAPPHSCSSGAHPTGPLISSGLGLCSFLNFCSHDTNNETNKLTDIEESVGARVIVVVPEGKGGRSSSKVVIMTCFAV
jgi:hypothetical protein